MYAIIVYMHPTNRSYRLECLIVVRNRIAARVCLVLICAELACSLRILLLVLQTPLEHLQMMSTRFTIRWEDKCGSQGLGGCKVCYTGSVCDPLSDAALYAILGLASEPVYLGSATLIQNAI